MEQRKFGGIFVRRNNWTLSGRAKIVVLVIVATGLGYVWMNISSFLGVNNGGSAETMVVEGWVSARKVDQAAATFKHGHYQRVIVVRDVYDEGDKWASGRYSADYVAADLIENGIPKDVVQTLFCAVVHKDRTYHCALAVRNWLVQNGISTKSLDVVTLATHARRSRLIYEKVFGHSVSVAAIALDDPSYDPAHWWQSSEGAREVVGETIAYAYVRFFFWPHPSNAKKDKEQYWSSSG